MKCQRVRRRSSRPVLSARPGFGAPEPNVRSRLHEPPRMEFWPSHRAAAPSPPRQQPGSATGQPQARRRGWPGRSVPASSPRRTAGYGWNGWPEHRLAHAPEAAIAAVSRVRQDPGARHASIEGPGDHLTRHGGLCRKLEILRHACLCPPLRVERPALGQVELAIDQGLAEATGIGQEDANLAVLDAACRPRVLPRNANRMRALLHKAGIVNDQHTIAITECFPNIVSHYVAQQISRPAAAPKQRLDAVG